MYAPTFQNETDVDCVHVDSHRSFGLAICDSLMHGTTPRRYTEIFVCDFADGTGPPASAGDIDVNGEEFHNCMAKVNLALSTVDGEQTVSIESIFDTRSGLISSLDVGTGEDMSDITRSIDFNELTVTATVSNLSGMAPFSDWSCIQDTLPCQLHCM